MASIETRKTKGRLTRYRVKWRTGGTRAGAWDGTTFDAYTDAKRFKALVEVHGHQWPPAEVLVAQGFAYLVPRAAAASVVTPAVPPVTFEAFARECVARLVQPAWDAHRSFAAAGFPGCLHSPPCATAGPMDRDRLAALRDRWPEHEDEFGGFRDT
ncbi:hypothetical protein [Couchioplanes azureus]|uniref:hypothetical protein n=1 Tax=Couchioplanes caeruleus TaxID=56438 RepID=UPI001670BEE4|nr:hypothetical protein [Couchioplanes caeruleus]GGQ84115.1 hypothetical protein GCM10010166_62960 [Couchioplanes caeruleus subsp. azureus]